MELKSFIIPLEEINVMKNKKIVITGGCGFVGSHFVEHFLKETDWDIIILDKLSYAANGYNRLRDINCFDDKRVSVFSVDLTQPLSEGVKQEIGKVDYIINLASESHVDNSIANPVEFIQNNVNLTLYMLEYAREIKPKKFIQFGTDEVYGAAPVGVDYREGDRHNPSSPYSASKAAQDDICVAYANTYKVPINITSTMNVFGERQHPEKFIPLCIKKILNDDTVTIHSDKEMKHSGTRFYIHARNVAKALYFLLEKDEPIDKYDASKGRFNLVGEREISNLDLARMIAKIMGKRLIHTMVDFHSSRPGHDLRYALDGSKLQKMGFEYPKALEESLEKTVKWFLKNPKWLG